MKNPLNGNGEISLLTTETKIVAVDGLEQWQVDLLTNVDIGDSCSSANACLMNIDYIATEWLKNLTKEEWDKIKRQKSLFGVKLPPSWIQVWRFILKEPQLRDREGATRGGRNVGSYKHLWNMWAEDCIEQYLSELDKELIELVDAGELYAEVGEKLLAKYGDEFWKKRKDNSKTTPAQVVNNYLYIKLPTKIARGELTDLCLRRLKIIE